MRTFECGNVRAGISGHGDDMREFPGCEASAVGSAEQIRAVAGRGAHGLAVTAF